MRYATRFQAKKQEQVQAQPKPNCICVLCSPARYEKKPIPKEEIEHIRAAIRNCENTLTMQSRVLLSAELFEYIVAHPAVMSSPPFYRATMQKIQEFENDSTVIAYKKL
jgi:hypothetical protein